MSRRNLITNPKAGAGVTTGWTPYNATIEAVTLADEGIDAPDEGCLTAFKLVRAASAPYVLYEVPTAPTPGRLYALRMARYVGAAPSGSEVISLGFYTAAGMQSLDSGDATVTEDRVAGWHYFSCVCMAPADAEKIILLFVGPNESYTAYFTAVQLEQTDDVRAYADGDSSGWEWDGTEDLSASRETGPEASTILGQAFDAQEALKTIIDGLSAFDDYVVELGTPQTWRDKQAWVASTLDDDIAEDASELLLYAGAKLTVCVAVTQYVSDTGWTPLRSALETACAAFEAALQADPTVNGTCSACFPRSLTVREAELPDSNELRLVAMYTLQADQYPVVG